MHHGRPGVYFFSLDAANPLAVMVARTMFNLPYFHASIEIHARDAGVSYHSRRTGDEPSAVLRAKYRPIGLPQAPTPGTLEHFLTERYCLYTVDESFHVRRLDIHHRPWPLQPAEATFQTNTMAEAAGIRLPSMAPVLHFAKRQDTVAWGMVKCE